MSVLWAAPFLALLLSIALMPLLAFKLWHHHYGKIVLAWALAFALPYASVFGWGPLAHELVHVAVAEYLPFVLLLTALFTVSGGIFVRGNLHGSPALNTGLLALGAVLGSVMGTTGASMLLIRPLIRANDNRKSCAHVVVFFIFIVSNIGGSLTPLGDPPLFLGFLQGVDFFWTLKHLLPETLFLVGALLVIFYALDSWYYRRDGVLARDMTPDSAFGLQGALNLFLLVVVAGLVLMSGAWKSSISLNVWGVQLALPALLRDAGLIAVTFISLFITPKNVHQANHFSWAPMQEVAKLFAGIFVTIIPVIAMLKMGLNGPFGAVVAAVTRPDGQPDPLMYFWATGLLSAFLDNAPTYLVFFNIAGGNAQQLMTQLAPTLAAISAGAVFMGACTYIGNAPNLMVKAVAEHRGVKMPSFFGYMAWSGAILLPLFVLISVLFLR